MVSCLRLLQVEADTTIRLWKLEGNQSSRVLVGHVEDVGAVAFSRDGLTLLFLEMTPERFVSGMSAMVDNASGNWFMGPFLV